jgi:GTPase SAR1 family protein
MSDKKIEIVDQLTYCPCCGKKFLNAKTFEHDCHLTCYNDLHSDMTELISESQNILILGEKGVGKTSFRNCLSKKKQVHHDIIVNDGCQSTYCEFQTNFGILKYNLIECCFATTTLEFALIKENYNAIKFCILMYDLTNSNTFENLTKWYENMKQVFPLCSYVVCGSKADLKQVNLVDNIVSICDIIKLKNIVFPYFELYTKSLKDCQNVVLFILQQMIANKIKIISNFSD